MSDKSGLKTMSLGLKTIDAAYSSLVPVRPSQRLKIVMGPRFKILSTLILVGGIKMLICDKKATISDILFKCILNISDVNVFSVYRCANSAAQLSVESM